MTTNFITNANEKDPSATNTGPFEKQTNALDFHTTVPPRKVIAIQIAQLAKAGHVVHQYIGGDYIVCKYGMTRYCQDLDELAAFARQLGVNHE